MFSMQDGLSSRVQQLETVVSSDKDATEILSDKVTKFTGILSDANQTLGTFPTTNFYLLPLNLPGYAQHQYLPAPKIDHQPRILRAFAGLNKIQSAPRTF